MRALIQRVGEASVSVNGEKVGTIGKGLLVLLGVEESDDANEISWLAGKIARLRLFPDEEGVMNHSVIEAGGEVLIVSQFTLHASTKKGNRPSYIRAARPETALPLYEAFVHEMETLLCKPVTTGVFGAEMQIALINDGPVTIWIDSKARE